MPTFPEARAKHAERRKRATRRLYRPHTLGPWCVSGCGLRVPLALSDTGILGHPTCGPEHRDLTRKAP